MRALIRIAICLPLLWPACVKEASRAKPETPRPKPETPRPEPSKPVATPATPAAPAAVKVPEWELDKVKNLGRLGKLTPRQRGLLTKNGFFLAPPPPPRKVRGALKRATHLFHVYERNDYIQFPSLVTADLAIDATHAYFDAVLREVEQRHLAPKLERALEALLSEAEKVRAAAGTPAGEQAARRAVAYWGVALHLLTSPAATDAPDEVEPRSAIPEDRPTKKAKPRRPRPAKAVPKAVRADVERAVKAIQSGGGRLPSGVLKASVDLTQMRPRGHYNRSGVLQRFFRAMSWLGMAGFHIKGEEADLPTLTLLARSWLGSRAGREGLDRVLEVTTFFAGGPDAADLRQAASRLKRVHKDAATASADQLVEKKLQSRLASALGDLKAPRIKHSATSRSAGEVHVRVMGRRAFEDAVAMQRILEPLMNMVKRGREERTLTRAMGALGSAAVLGSDLARHEVLMGVEPDERDALAKGVELGRREIERVRPDRWKDDAYHGTLHALRAMLTPPLDGAPSLLRTGAWRLRGLQAFAGGWAELRHDTILYGEQLGAECDAPDPAPPPGWVEPVPEVYGRLGAMVRRLDARFKRARIPRKATDQNNPYARPLSEKAELVLDLLSFLEKAARQELAGKPLTRAQRKKITLIGGTVEWLMITLANTDLLQPRDKDMAVVADVFTWRLTSQAVEVGVAHPDLIYALVPGPGGKPVIARGAVMSYREFLHPKSSRMTDEEWRRRLAAGKGPGRPEWVGSIYAEPVRAIRLRGRGVDRCGPSSGSIIEL